MTTPAIQIFGRRIACDEAALVIAEIGVNHDGSVTRALELVEIAAECGADAVKLQLFKADQLMHDSAAFAGYQKTRVHAQNPADMLRKYELSRSDASRVVEAIRDHEMIPIATPFSPADCALVEELRLPAVKIASPDLVNRPLLQAAAQIGKPLLISTGAAAMQEIEATRWWMREWAAPFALLHCVSSYPTPAHEANLCWIGELAQRFDAAVGYSDHTTDLVSGSLAVAAGACIVEKHLTYDRSAAGPDHSASADAAQFAEYVKLIRQAERLRGKPGKRVLAVEEDVRRVSRQSLVTRRRLHAGDIVRADDLTVKRPGTGIPAAMVERVVGCVVRRTIQADTLLTWEILGGADAVAA